MKRIDQAQSVIQKMNKKSKMGKIMKKVIILIGTLAVLLCFDSCFPLMGITRGDKAQQQWDAERRQRMDEERQRMAAERQRDEEGNSYRFPLFSVFLKQYTEKQIEDWQKKGEFEKTAEWQERVNEETRKQKIAEITDNAVSAYIQWLERRLGNIYEPLPLSGKLILGQYDADNEIYIVTSENFGDIPVFVPIDEASDFKHSWNSYSHMSNVDKYPNYSARSRVTYFIKNDQPALAKVVFCNKYTYRNSDAPLDVAK